MEGPTMPPAVTSLKTTHENWSRPTPAPSSAAPMARHDSDGCSHSCVASWGRHRKQFNPDPGVKSRKQSLQKVVLHQHKGVMLRFHGDMLRIKEIWKHLLGVSSDLKDLFQSRQNSTCSCAIVSSVGNWEHGETLSPNVSTVCWLLYVFLTPTLPSSGFICQAAHFCQASNPLC